MDDKFQVYILYSSTTDSYYVGHTNDVNRRLKGNNRENIPINFVGTALSIMVNLEEDVDYSESINEIISNGEKSIP